MRRLKPVHILISSDFYRIFDTERKKAEAQIQKKFNINRPLTHVKFSEMLVKSKANFPKINLGGLSNVKRKKSRCF